MALQLSRQVDIWPTHKPSPAHDKMFLILSKLLPLFVYPLGLACVLLVVALVLMGRRSRWAPLPVVLALLILGAAGNGSINIALLTSLEWRYVPQGELPTADAIVVLGGGLVPHDSPRPDVEVAEGGDRTLYAAKLYDQGKAPMILVSGGRVSWDGEQIPESRDMASLLRRLGVPNNAIWQEPNSLNTYENAVLSKPILERREAHKILLVTSATHMPRARAVFAKQGFEVVPAPADFRVTELRADVREKTLVGRLLHFIPDTGNFWTTTMAIKEYVGIFIYWLRGWI
ncbi:MAG: YdcF family protein [Cyanobacteria bacterium P01_G01_bin.54]